MPNTDNNNLNRILEKIDALEGRVSLLENAFQKGLKPHNEPLMAAAPQIANESKVVEAEEEQSIESRIGEYGLAWAGSIILLFSIVFLMFYVNSIGNSIWGSLIGYLGTAIVFVLSYYLRNSFPGLIRILRISGYVLLFFVTMLLHFFSADPVLHSLGLSLILLLASIGLTFNHALKNKSEFIGSLGILMLLFSSVIADSTYISLSLLAISAGVSTYLFHRLGWTKSFFLTMILVYLTHLMWLFGNPVMGHPATAVTMHQNNIIFLFAYGLVFSLTALKTKRNVISEELYNTIILLNGFVFSAVLLAVVLLFFQDNFEFIFGTITILCLSYALILDRKEVGRLAPSIFAVYGFMALSVVVYGITSFPNTFLYLSIQSFLVLSLALLFRSKTIVIANMLMFITLLGVYLALGNNSNPVNLTFALVALASSRFINWQKERLIIKTEFIRNIYLFFTFITILIAVYHAVPAQYISLTWAAVAVGLFVTSLLLKNEKYRYLSFGIIFVTIIHLFFVDMASMSLGLRVVAFLVLAVISLGLSVYYAKNKKPE